MAIKIGKLFGTDKLVGTDDDDLLIALGAKTTLIGGLGNDVLLGGLNNDILIGGKGADFLSGGLGTDTVDYSGSDAGVTVSLTTGKGSGGDAEGDTIVLVENVIGSAFDDVLTGDKGNNILTGGDGDDIFVLTKGKDVITDFTPGIAGTPSTEVLIDFQDRPLNQTVLFDVYQGLNWNWGVTHGLNAPNGYQLLYDFDGDIGFRTVDDDFDGLVNATLHSTSTDFDLQSLEISGGGAILLDVRIEAYDDSILVGSVELSSVERVSVDFVNKIEIGAVGTPVFSGHFTSIDAVRFVHLANNNIAIDDIKIVYPGIPGDGGDRIDVADGTDIAALVASAVSNGKGGTMLTHSQGKLELLGVDPSSVSADWFV